METRTKRGFPHFHSDDDGGLLTATTTNPTKIGGCYRFLHRTEQRFPAAGLFQRSDITGCIQQLQSGKPFIAKLHGSRGTIESTVFAHDDYETLKADTAYINTLRLIFSLGTVVFLGYSVSDQYVIDLLSDNARDMSLFGSGPHFVVSSDFKGSTTLRQIEYSLKRFADHRSALTVLDLIRQVEARKAELSARVLVSGERAKLASPLGAKTAYFISDVMPAGTWNNSVIAQLETKDSRKVGFVRRIRGLVSSLATCQEHDRAQVR